MSLKVVMKAQETFQQDESAKVETYWKIVNGNTLESHDKQHTFVYDKIFDETRPISEIFQEFVDPIIADAFDGINATVTSYEEAFSKLQVSCLACCNLGDGDDNGILSLAANSIFRRINRENKREHRVHIGYIQIQKNKIYDLLDRSRELQNEETLISKLHLATHAQDVLDIFITGSSKWQEKCEDSIAVFAIVLQSKENEREEFRPLSTIIFRSVLLMKSDKNQIFERERTKDDFYSPFTVLWDNSQKVIICKYLPTNTHETLLLLKFASEVFKDANQPQTYGAICAMPADLKEMDLTTHSNADDTNETSAEICSKFQGIESLQKMENFLADLDIHNVLKNGCTFERKVDKIKLSDSMIANNHMIVETSDKDDEEVSNIFEDSSIRACPSRRFYTSSPTKTSKKKDNMITRQQMDSLKKQNLILSTKVEKLQNDLIKKDQESKKLSENLKQINADYTSLQAALAKAENSPKSKEKKLEDELKSMTARFTLEKVRNEDLVKNVEVYEVENRNIRAAMDAFEALEKQYIENYDLMSSRDNDFAQICKELKALLDETQVKLNEKSAENSSLLYQVEILSKDLSDTIKSRDGIIQKKVSDYDDKINKIEELHQEVELKNAENSKLADVIKQLAIDKSAVEEKHLKLVEDCEKKNSENESPTLHAMSQEDICKNYDEVVKINSELKETLEQENSKKSVLQNVIQEKDTEIENLKFLVKALEEGSGTLDKNTTGKLTSLETQLDNAKKAQTSLLEKTAENSSLLYMNMQLKEDLAERNSLIKIISEDYDEELKELRQEADSKIAENSKLVDTIKQLSADKSAVEEKCLKLVEDCEKKNSENESLTHHVKSLQDICKNYGEVGKMNSELKETLDREKSEKFVIQENYQKTAMVIQEKDTEIEHLKLNIKLLEDDLNEGTSDEIASLEAQLSDANERLSTAQQKLKDSTQRTGQRDVIIINLKCDLEKKNKTIEILQKQSEALKEENSKLADSIAQLSSESAGEKLMSEIQQLHSKLEKIKLNEQKCVRDLCEKYELMIQTKQKVTNEYNQYNPVYPVQSRVHSIVWGKFKDIAIQADFTEADYTILNQQLDIALNQIADLQADKKESLKSTPLRNILYSPKNKENEFKRGLREKTSFFINSI